MPEEINRVVTDRVSNLLFLPSRDASENLAAEGVPADRMHFVGNVMIDTLCRSEEHTSELQSQSNLVCRLLLEKKNMVIGQILTSRLSLSKHLAHNLGNLLLLGKLGD